MTKRILVINPFGIGDVTFSTPLLEVLKKEYPDSFIGYICNRRVSELIASNPCVDKIFMYEKDDYREAWARSKIQCVKKIWAFLTDIKNGHFDTSIDLSLAYPSSMLFGLVGIKKRLGLNYKNRGRFLTDKIDIDGFTDKHVIEYYSDVLKLLGIDTRKYQLKPKLYVSEQDRMWADSFLRNNGISQSELLIGLVPGCGASWGPDAKYRRWNPENFANVGDVLIDKYKARIILFGDSKEVGLCDKVKATMHGDVLTTCGKTSVGQLLGLLSKCGLLITNEGGTLHMAVAIDVPTVSIFGPVDDRIYGPYPASNRHAVITGDLVPCRPCYKKFKYRLCETNTCVSSISVEKVLKAAEKLLS